MYCGIDATTGKGNRFLLLLFEVCSRALCITVKVLELISHRLNPVRADREQVNQASEVMLDEIAGYR